MKLTSVKRQMFWVPAFIDMTEAGEPGHRGPALTRFWNGMPGFILLRIIIERACT